MKKKKKRRKNKKKIIKLFNNQNIKKKIFVLIFIDSSQQVINDGHTRKSITRKQAVKLNKKKIERPSSGYLKDFENFLSVGFHFVSLMLFAHHSYRRSPSI